MLLGNQSELLETMLVFVQVSQSLVFMCMWEGGGEGSLALSLQIL